jgi:hypothetical protein
MAVEFWKHPVAATAIRCFKSQGSRRLRTRRVDSNQPACECDELGTWGSAIGAWFANRCKADLHGLGTKHRVDPNLFNDNKYVWHYLLNGYRCVRHFPILPVDPALQMIPSGTTKSEGNLRSLSQTSFQ